MSRHRKDITRRKYPRYTATGADGLKLCASIEGWRLARTQLNAYEALKMPELWCYVDRKLQINVLRDGQYIQVETSPIFPDLPAIAGITKFIEMSRTEGTSPALRAFRQWVGEQIL